MGYQPNVVSKKDIVEINGVLFECQNDFNKLKGDKKLKLKYIGDTSVDKRMVHRGILLKA